MTTCTVPEVWIARDAINYHLSRVACPDHVLDKIRCDAPPCTDLPCGRTEAASLHPVNSVLGPESLTDLSVLGPCLSHLRVVSPGRPEEAFTNIFG